MDDVFLWLPVVVESTHREDPLPGAYRSLVTAELLATTAGRDEMGITEDLIAAARDRISGSLAIQAREI